ncbi:hypothetical protein BC936DRAFT_147188 [Jimgerdemannia flammicorona]|uniref:Uncharacterized protein n=1 Tax=Jimgerdemannia flammicorona TaxID=994334 RepID=A0A433D5X4_9FUNG|nr:hypothetical protein BC936DRAFT_147188 [Jimgerdemannia flammicorona]
MLLTTRPSPNLHELSPTRPKLRSIPLERAILPEIQLHTVHHGRVLVGRTISQSMQSLAIHVEIEDPIIGEGPSAAQETKVTTAHLFLYNFNISGMLCDVLDLIIKGPYNETCMEDGLPMLRCDSPDDVILVLNEQVDGPLPRSGKIDNMQRNGNEQFNRKEYASAIDSYTQALELESDAVLLSNRAQAHLQLQQFGKALEDAETAFKT